jgi:hypothetical protein
MTPREDSIVIANEFAHVTVRLAGARNDTRLEISAPKRERSVRLDAATLWALAGEPSETFTALLSDAPIGIKED